MREAHARFRHASGDALSALKALCAYMAVPPSQADAFCRWLPDVLSRRRTPSRPGAKGCASCNPAGSQSCQLYTKQRLHKRSSGCHSVVLPGATIKRGMTHINKVCPLGRDNFLVARSMREASALAHQLRRIIAAQARLLLPLVTLS